MDASSEDTIAASEKEPGLRFYFTREPMILALLSAIAVVLFLGVGGLSRVYHAQRESLGNRWFARGVEDLKQQRYEQAVGEFRAALRYSRDNYAYQLNLAQALVGLKRTSEAYAYLINLWEREPENGLVNLELARIAAQKGETEQALRYYHNAIYAAWPSNQGLERRNVRLELIEYLLGIKAQAQAQSELIALAANLFEDPSQHQRVADLFVQAQDYEHALAEYRLALESDYRDAAALAGAGLAAFELGRYPVAQRYLEETVAANPKDGQSVDRLKTVELIVQMDPFRRQIPVDQRNRIVIQAFETSGERLKSCSAAGDSAERASPQTLGEMWTKMKPQITERSLGTNPDLVESAMDLVFAIERKSNTLCGPPTGTDMALLLISKLHEGN